MISIDEATRRMMTEYGEEEPPVSVIEYKDLYVFMTKDNMDNFRAVRKSDGRAVAFSPFESMDTLAAFSEAAKREKKLRYQ